MGPYNNDSIVNPVDTIHWNDPPVPEEFDCLRIVYKRPVCIYFLIPFMAGYFEDYVNCPLHTHAKARCLGKFNSHLSFRVDFQHVFWSTERIPCFRPDR